MTMSRKSKKGRIHPTNEQSCRNAEKVAAGLIYPSQRPTPHLLEGVRRLILVPLSGVVHWLREVQTNRLTATELTILLGARGSCDSGVFLTVKSIQRRRGRSRPPNHRLRPLAPVRSTSTQLTRTRNLRRYAITPQTQLAKLTPGSPYHPYTALSRPRHQRTIGLGQERSLPTQLR